MERQYAALMKKCPKRGTKKKEPDGIEIGIECRIYQYLITVRNQIPRNTVYVQEKFSSGTLIKHALSDSVIQTLRNVPQAYTDIRLSDTREQVLTLNLGTYSQAKRAVGVLKPCQNCAG